MNLEFSKIKRENIFNNDFEDMKQNNTVDFSDKNIAVLYAPNGVGKSSLCKILSGDGEYDLKYNNISYDQNNCDLFHIINDQNSRNIIKGHAKEFLIGDDIAKEFELKEWIDENFLSIFNSVKDKLKNEIDIAKQTDKKIDWMDIQLMELIKKIAKKDSSVENIDLSNFLNVVRSISLSTITDFCEEKMDFIKKNDIIVNELQSILTITQNENFEKIEENVDAIKILEKYITKTYCIVCDNDKINSENLLNNKITKKSEIISSLDSISKKIFEKIIEKIPDIDPFNIKKILTNSISLGNIKFIIELNNEINNYKDILKQKANNIFADSLFIEFKQKYDEYLKMTNMPLEFTDEDILYIEQFIENNINKKIKLTRNNNKIKLVLDELDFLEIEREKLKLSSGEQNFISLAFELLKAKNSKSEIIVIDDPISSFDSIFKNKLVYAIIKFLENKNLIIMTHNSELLRLLEVQKENSFNLYLFNNFINQKNGFISVSDHEKNILIFIPKLLEFMRSAEIDTHIKNERLFIYSLIPFMRGYTNFINDTQTKNELNKLMHGYNTEIVELKTIYNTIFNKSIVENYNITVDNLLSIDINSMPEIIDINQYPLFNEILVNNFIYLYLRLKTEKILVDKYSININKYDTLAAIINKSFSDGSELSKKNRIVFFSKKTLLNEFNHFDGNMNIFQPAIDISQAILNKEKKEILDKLEEILNN